MAIIFGETTCYKSETILLPPDVGVSFDVWRRARRSPSASARVSAHQVVTTHLPVTGYFLLTSFELRAARITVPDEMSNSCYGYITQRNKEVATWIFDTILDRLTRQIAQEIEEFLPDPRVW